ncbi:MAG: DNA-3-methyladenine glycosylase family protein [Granulosicoccaceae bacterium]
MGLTRAQIKHSLDQLAREDPLARRAIAEVGYPAPRHRPQHFSTLLQIIASQQISTHAAAAVWRRLDDFLGGDISAAHVLKYSEQQLKGAGLSARKAEYALDLAARCESGELNLRGLSSLEDEQAIAAITAVRGLGRWSAEIYLLFAEGRPDVWPADDLAIQVAFQTLHGLEQRPKGKAFYPLTQKWSPHRGAGALLMWKLYGSATLSK